MTMNSKLRLGLTFELKLTLMLTYRHTLQLKPSLDTVEVEADIAVEGGFQACSRSCWLKVRIKFDAAFCWC